LKDSGRAEYIVANDEEALRAFRLCTQLEGIIPALETAHAIWGTIQIAKTLPKDANVVMVSNGSIDMRFKRNAEYSPHSACPDEETRTSSRLPTLCPASGPRPSTGTSYREAMRNVSLSDILLSGRLLGTQCIPILRHIRFMTSIRSMTLRMGQLSLRGGGRRAGRGCRLVGRFSPSWLAVLTPSTAGSAFSFSIANDRHATSETLVCGSEKRSDWASQRHFRQRRQTAHVVLVCVNSRKLVVVE